MKTLTTLKSLKKLLFVSFVGLITVSSLSFTLENKRMEKKKKQKREMTIQNNTEYGQLEEAVIGRWVPESFNVPEVDESLAEFFPFIPDAAWEYMKKAENQLISDKYPEDDQKYYQEQEDFVKIVESLGVKVHRPDEIEFPTTGTSQCYSRDPIITIGNKFIITNLRSETRRMETPSYRRIALELAEKYDGEVISMPALKAGYPEENAYLEGGDVFVDGKDIYVGVSGNASNQNGIDFLQEELGSSYTVHAIPLQHHVLHLDCAMMLINDKQGVICKEDFIDFDALPKGLKKREYVEVAPEKAQIMATNGMVINSKTVIMIDAFPDVIAQVRDMGIEVIEVPFAKANYFGGGLRCSFQPIRRK